MKAAILRELNRPLQIEEVQIDRPGPLEVLVRTGATGVCHSDLHFMEGKLETQMPTVLGHEGAGTVEEVGQGVTYVKPGDRVITCLSDFCGECKMCLSGRPNLCGRAGLERPSDETPRLRQGDTPIPQFCNVSSFAEQMLVHERATVKVRDDVPVEVQALIGCGVTTGLGAVLNTSRVKPGSTVVVIGCGGVGLSCIQGAAIAGALRIIAIDRVETKLEMARNLGATDVIDPADGDIVEQVLELTGGGVDYSFEAIGNKETAEQAFRMLKPGATFTMVGAVPVGTKLEFDGLELMEERRVQGSKWGSSRFRIDMPRYVELYRQGRLKLDEMVSQRLSLEQVNKAFDDMKKGEVARSVITFG